MKIKRIIARATGLMALAALSPFASAATCEYLIANEWNSGFTANIRITNTDSAPINGWEVSWGYTDGSSRTSGWNANVSGSNPYTATPLNWNSTINPGQFIEFGVQGSKGSAPSGPPGYWRRMCAAKQQF